MQIIKQYEMWRKLLNKIKHDANIKLKKNPK